MKKIFSFFLGLILLASLLAPQKIYAASCSITSPSTVTTNDRTIDVTIQEQGLVPGKSYVAWMNPSVGGNIADQSKGGQTVFLTVTNGQITIQNLNAQGLVNPIPQNSTLFENKTYTISIAEYNTIDKLCSASFTVNQATSGGTCKIEFRNTPDKFTVNDDIVINVANLGGNPGDGRRIVIKRNKENEKNDYRTFSNNVGQLTAGVVIGKFEAGVYYLEIRSGQDFLANRDCYTNFGIGEKGGFGPVGQFPTPSPICQGGLCDTALGKIFTDPANFVKTFFGILLSLAGGIAIILIIISGYRLMSSGGNPEKVQASREQLTSAIVGLLFIIFSLSILQIIGVDILHIPGLTK